MSFSAGSVSTLDYDFTAIPREDGQGTCSGKGIVTEPSEGRIKAFATALSEFQARVTEIEAEASKEGIDDATEEALKVEAEALTSKVKEVVADFCAGSPSLEELTQLPPRYFRAFTSWLGQELSPKG